MLATQAGGTGVSLTVAPSGREEASSSAILSSAAQGGAQWSCTNRRLQEHQETLGCWAALQWARRRALGGYLPLLSVPGHTSLQLEFECLNG